jgi:hypothetical protein
MAIGTAAAIGLGIAATATAGSLYQQNRAAKQQSRQLDFQRQQAALSQNIQRREQIRAARIAQAQAQLAGATQGVDTGSSGLAGGTGSIISQLGSNLGFNLQMQSLSDQAGDAMGKAIRAGNRAQIFGGIAQLALTASSFAPNKAPTDTPNQVTNSGTIGTGP